jgi:hypothetical protein
LPNVSQRRQRGSWLVEVFCIVACLPHVSPLGWIQGLADVHLEDVPKLERIWSSQLKSRRWMICGRNKKNLKFCESLHHRARKRKKFKE